jgi:KipI family sensor histidine kinase inhibitor
VRFLPAGDHALLVELGSLEEVHRLHRAVSRAGIATDAVPAWRTLLVSSALPRAALEAALRTLDVEQEDVPRPRELVIPVVYDGEDLDDVAAATGLTRDEVVAEHSAAEFTVAFLGFSRGFPYLAGLPASLQLPRRATPRARVPTGSVAIALDACGIYPQSSPGGWHLLGTTPESLFDPSVEPPSKLQHGDLVRFREVRG